MTLGPDRKTRARWLLGDTEPLLYPPSDGGEGGGAAADDDADTDDDDDSDDDADDDDESDDDDDDESDDDDDGATDGKQSGKAAAAKGKGKSVVIEVEGKKYVSQDYVNEITRRERIAGEERGKKAAADAAKAERLKKQGNFEQLYKDAEAKRVAAEQERDDERLKSQRIDIGAKYGLSVRVSSRLTGKTVKEIEKDAKEMAAEIGAKPGDAEAGKKGKKAPSTEGGNGSKVRQKGNGTADDKTPARPFVFQGENDVKRQSW